MKRGLRSISLLASRSGHAARFVFVVVRFFFFFSFSTSPFQSNLIAVQRAMTATPERLGMSSAGVEMPAGRAALALMDWRQGVWIAWPAADETIRCELSVAASSSIVQGCCRDEHRKAREWEVTPSAARYEEGEVD